MKNENPPSTLIPNRTSRMVNPTINFHRAMNRRTFDEGARAFDSSTTNHKSTTAMSEIPRHGVLTIVGTRWNWLLLGQWVIEVEYCCLDVASFDYSCLDSCSSYPCKYRDTNWNSPSISSEIVRLNFLGYTTFHLSSFIIIDTRI